MTHFTNGLTSWASITPDTPPHPRTPRALKGGAAPTRTPCYPSTSHHAATPCQHRSSPDQADPVGRLVGTQLRLTWQGPWEQDGVPVDDHESPATPVPSGLTIRGHFADPDAAVHPRRPRPRPSPRRPGTDPKARIGRPFSLDMGRTAHPRRSRRHIRPEVATQAHSGLPVAS